MLEKTERLIAEINLIHLKYSAEYFETGKVNKVNLTQTLRHINLTDILQYRLNLHESINDYLISANVQDISFYYRVKTSESIQHKVARYLERDNQYPTNNILNDIFGARIILPSEKIGEVLNKLDDWKEKYGLKNWYLNDKNGYIGIHVYFKNKSNFYYPWELQIWDIKDVEANIANHKLYKRSFVNQ
ncbi:MAG: hypothetical protein IJ566_07555 [Cardiobacteriaceae bacterium]|nr:hypothetical protein [Cardiobacteriaceae bacterium]